MDSYVKQYVRMYIHIDAGNRAHDRKTGKELQVVMSGGDRKVVLPCTKILYTFDDLKRNGAKCDTITLKTLAVAGAEGRWKENIEARKGAGLPSNVYVANSRSIEYALEKGKVPPPIRYVGRVKNQITEVRDTVDEVVEDIANNRWRTEFSRGRNAKRRT